MKLSHSYIGITLVELVISMVIITMISGGIFTALYAVQKMDSDATHRAALSMRVQAVAQHIRNNALRMHGDKTTPGWASLNASVVVDGDNYFCFRQGVSATPRDYSNDKWACYSMLKPGGTRTELYFCANLAAATKCLATDQWLGSLALNTFNDAASPTTTARAPTFNLAQGLFSVTIVSRVTAGSGVAISGGNLTTGTQLNPQVFFNLTVHPDNQSSN